MSVRGKLWKTYEAYSGRGARAVADGLKHVGFGEYERCEARS